MRVEILYSNECPGWPQRAVVANRLGDGAAKAVDAHVTRQQSIYPALTDGSTVAAASPVNDSRGAAGHEAGERGMTGSPSWPLTTGFAHASVAGVSTCGK